MTRMPIHTHDPTHDTHDTHDTHGTDDNWESLSLYRAHSMVWFIPTLDGSIKSRRSGWSHQVLKRLKCPNINAKSRVHQPSREANVNPSSILHSGSSSSDFPLRKGRRGRRRRRGRKRRERRGRWRRWRRWRDQGQVEYKVRHTSILIRKACHHFKITWSLEWIDDRSTCVLVRTESEPEH